MAESYDPNMVIPASLEALRLIVSEHQYRVFEWPVEGEDYKGRLVTNRKTSERRMIVDATTANVMVKVYDALERKATREKFEHWIAKSPHSFIKMMKLSWEAMQ